jgi:hypothetical protein
MYVADRLSVQLNTRLVRAEGAALDPARSACVLRGVHLTDGSSAIVSVNLQESITYDDCAPFFSNALGYENGAIVSPWRHIILVRDSRSVLSEELGLVMGTSAIDRPIVDQAELEFWLSVLVAAHPVAAPVDERDEFGDSDEDAPAQAQAQEQAQEQVQVLGAGAAAGHDAALDQIDIDGLDLDEIQFENVVMLIERHVAQYGGLPTQNGPRYCALGRRVQFFRTSYQRMIPERAARLERVPGWSWRPHDDAFLTRLQEFIEYTEHIAQHPDGPLPPRYMRVPQWITYNRRRYVRDELKPERIAALTSTPGWSWE